jgi:hypothetical protein
MQKNNKKLKKIAMQRYNFRVCRDRLMSVSTAILGLLIAGGFVCLGRFGANLCFGRPICCKKAAFCDFLVPYGQFYPASNSMDLPTVLFSYPVLIPFCPYV